MKLSIILSAILAVIANCETPHSQYKELNQLIEGNHKFAAELYLRLVKGRQDKNFVFSPLTIGIALGLASIGAKGKTADEITNAISLPADKNDLIKSLEQLASVVESKDYKISKAIGLFLGENVTILDSFKEIVKKCPGAKLDKVDFNNVDKSLEVVNRWVQKQAHHKVKNLLTEDDINENTQFLLINTVFFNATWQHPFSMLPSKKRFRISRTRSKFVDMMTVTNYFKHYDLSEFDATAIELLYEGNDASMVIVLPNKQLGDLSIVNENLGKIIKITSNDCIDKCSTKYMTVEMPLFTVWGRFPLISDLRELGIQAAFTNEADFSDISNSPIKLHNVVQKAFVNVTTTGTVAAGVPADKLGHMRMIPNEVPATIFEANNPFVFYINVRNITIMIGYPRTGHFMKTSTLNLLPEPMPFELFSAFFYFIKVRDIIILAGKVSHNDGFHD